MHALRFSVAIAIMSPTIAFAQSAPATASASSTYSADSEVGTLLDNADTKAVLIKYVPALVSSPQIEVARGMTLRSLQQFASDMLTNDVLAKIDADLAKVPVKK